MARWYLSSTWVRLVVAAVLLGSATAASPEAQPQREAQPQTRTQPQRETTEEEQPATAGQPAGPARFETDVVVTPERGEALRAEVPAATVVIERAQLASLPVAHPAETLSFTPGFTMMQGEFASGRPVISARGFFGGGEAEYVLVLVDGQPIGDVESGLIDWSLVPTASVRRIEAYRGPGASLYGDAAVGGVIQILTDTSADQGWLTLSGGTFGSLTGDGAYGLRARGVIANMSGAARRTDGAFEHSRAHQFVGAGSLAGATGDAAWRWAVTGEQRERDDPGSATTAAIRANPRTSDSLFRFDRAERSRVSTSFTLRSSALAWRPHVRFQIVGRNEDVIRTLLLAPGLGDTRGRTLSTLALAGSVEGEHTFVGTGHPVVRAGMDVSREHLDTQYFDVTADGTVGRAASSLVDGARLRAGLFLSGSVAPVARVRLTGALRWDRVDDTRFVSSLTTLPSKTAWSPRGGVVVQLSESGAVSLFAQASRAFKAPTVDQMFDPRPYPDFRGGTFSISNPTLTPQRATSIEAGMSGRGPLRWTALAYRMSVDDEIDFDLRTFTYVNIGRSRHVGAELDVEGTWWPRARPLASYAWTRVSNPAGADQVTQLKNIPRHVVSVGVSVDGPWQVSAFARVRHSTGAFLDDENALPMDGPSTLDLRVRRPFGRHVLFVDVLNATNNVFEEYGYTLPDFRGGVVPYAYAGALRAVRVGATLSF